jgi:hypothetical protein
MEKPSDLEKVPQSEPSSEEVKSKFSEKELEDLYNDNYKGREDEDPRLESMKQFK